MRRVCRLLVAVLLACDHASVPSPLDAVATRLDAGRPARCHHFGRRTWRTHFQRWTACVYQASGFMLQSSRAPDGRLAHLSWRQEEPDSARAVVVRDSLLHALSEGRPVRPCDLMLRPRFVIDERVWRTDSIVVRVRTERPVPSAPPAFRHFVVQLEATAVWPGMTLGGPCGEGIRPAS